MKCPISLENVNPGGRSWSFSIFGPLGCQARNCNMVDFSDILYFCSARDGDREEASEEVAGRGRFTVSVKRHVIPQEIPRN